MKDDSELLLISLLIPSSTEWEPLTEFTEYQIAKQIANLRDKQVKFEIITDIKDAKAPYVFYIKSDVFYHEYSSHLCLLNVKYFKKGTIIIIENCLEYSRHSNRYKEKHNQDICIFRALNGPHKKIIDNEVEHIVIISNDVFTTGFKIDEDPLGPIEKSLL